jgi:cobaltochelatase CobN
MVGLSIWGTREQGDDVAEVLAFLGVRPLWNSQSRGIEGVSPSRAAGARIDVTVRISGFAGTPFRI